MRLSRSAVGSPIMLQDHMQSSGQQNIRLARQPRAPTETQIKELQERGLGNAGRTVELPFLDGDDNYSLTVFTDGSKDDCLWMLYKGLGTAANLLWSMMSDDPGLIHHLLCSQLSGFSRAGRSEFALDDSDGLMKPDRLVPPVPPSVNADDASLPHLKEESRQTGSRESQPGGMVMTSAQLESSPESANQFASGQHSVLRLGESGMIPPVGKRSSDTSGRLKQKPMLEGDLVNLQMPTLLQSIAMGKMTGRLEVESFADKAVIYFNEGAPLHCELRDSEGETAIVEVIGWDEGTFKFLPGSAHDRATVRKRLDLLLMEGAALIDQSRFLKDIGISFESYLVRNHLDLSERVFEEMVAKGPAIDLNLQKLLYQLIDNRTTLEELLRKRPLPKPRWVPVIFSLVTCGLISFSEKQVDWQHEQLEPAEIDWTAIRAFEKSISAPETGFLTYPAFFYMLDREFNRFLRFQRPFSLILFELELKEESSEVEDESVLLDSAILSQVAQRVERIMRKTDLIGHFEPCGFAMLLTETEAAAAKSFSVRLAEIIASSPLTTRGLLIIRVGLRIGVGSAPDNAKDLGTLISAARPYDPEKL